MMEAVHRGPFGGMIVICVDVGTEVTAEDGSTAVVDDNHTVISGKGALYVTPKIYEALKNRTEPESSAKRQAARKE